MLKRHITLGDNGSKYINNYKLTLIQLHCYNCKNNKLIIIYYIFETDNGSMVETTTMHLKESKSLSKQLLAPNLPRLRPIGLLQTPEEKTNDGNDNRKQRKIVRRYDDSYRPLDVHGVEMKMNPNLNVSSAVKNVIFRLIVIVVYLFI